LESRLAAAGVAFELHLADLPSSWFAQAHELLHGCPWVRFHSLRDPGGHFRNVLELSGGRPFDAVVASMVFHLIPARAMARVAADLSGAMTPGGQLLWNSPDLGPSGPYSVLFHDPNRALRRRWVALMDGEAALPHSGVTGHDPVAAEAARRAQSNLGPGDRAACARRAERRILQSPNEADFVNRALGEHLRGTMERCTFEMLDGDFVDALLIPSNGGEYLPEIDSREERGEVIRRLMLGEILPAFSKGPAATGLGLSVQWTFGAMRRDPRDRC
jgi:hypothetical protein